MEKRSPIYTEKSRCQDCNKCVRNCPVKAIIIEDGTARVEPNLCIYCGTCVRVCPQGAKTVRSDIHAAELLLKEKKEVYAALAPSYVSEFPNLSRFEIIAALKELGFAGVSETALGAQEVSAGIAEWLENHENEILISSACPVIVEYINKYLPRYGGNVADMLSPVLAQGKLLQEKYGPDIGIVFFGPCIAKKREADFFPDLLDVALTFQEMHLWLEDKLSGGAAVTISGTADFVPERAREGALYPLDGGMTAGIKSNCPVTDMTCMSFSGLEGVKNALSGLPLQRSSGNLFLELLACEGGCVNGPGASSREATIAKRSVVLSRADIPEKLSQGKPKVDIYLSRGLPEIPAPDFSDHEIKTALELVGKYSRADELDCSGCGYDTCRDFAAALLSGKAERTMCVSYMRRIAQKESNELLAAMPTAAVIMDEEMRILDCNKKFAAILGSEIEDIFIQGISLTGVKLEKYLPFTDLFQQVLSDSIEVTNKDVKLGETVFNITVFPVEAHAAVGAILQDVTEPVVQKERIVSRAKEVIRKNLSTAQQIASLLGENAADSEMILESIIKTFKPSHDAKE